VKVDLLPASILLIKGEFISEIDPGLKKARITIEDAQNKRQIGVFNTDDDAAYIVDFSYGGAYNFYVEAGNSGIIHTGKVEIPRLQSMHAFRQELILMDDNGVERLMIKNYFEEEIDDNLQELLAEALKRRAELNVTPVEQMELLEEENKDEDISNLYRSAGFTFLHSNDEVLDWAASKRAELVENNTEFNALAAKALAESQISQDNADVLIEAAKESYVLFENSTDDPVKQDALRASITQRNDAKIDLLNANASLAMSNRLLEVNEERDAFIAEIQLAETNLQEALASNDEVAISASLNELYELEQKLKNDRAGISDPATYLAQVKEVEGMKAMQSYDNAEALREEKNDQLNKLKALQTKLINAKGADKNEIESEIAESKAQLEKLNTEIPEKWEEYQELDWNSKVAEKSYEFANTWDYSQQEPLSVNLEETNLFNEEFLTSKKEIAAMEELDNEALLSLGMSYETLMKNDVSLVQNDENDINEALESNEGELEADASSELAIQNDLIENYNEKLAAIRANENTTDQLEGSMLLNAELVKTLNASIADNQTSYTTQELEELKAQVELETAILYDEYKKSIEEEQNAVYTMDDIIPGFEEQKEDIIAYGGTELEKKNQLLNFYNITIDRLDLILDSLTMLPVDGDLFIMRQQIEYQNSVKILSTELKVKRYELKQNVVLLSTVASLPNEAEMIELLDPEYEAKYEMIVNSSADADMKEAQKIQLNESLIAKLNNEMANLGKKMNNASPNEMAVINSKVNVIESIIAEKEEEINDMVLEMAKGNVSPDALVQANADKDIIISDEESMNMLSVVYPNLEQELTAIEISDMSNSEKVEANYEVYQSLASMLDSKVDALAADDPSRAQWLALQRDVDQQLMDMEGYLSELSAGEEAIAGAESKDADLLLSDDAQSWKDFMDINLLNNAIESYDKTGRIEADPGFSSESMRAEAMAYYGEIQSYNGMIDQMEALQKSENSASEKELKKIKKQEEELKDEMISDENDLLVNWVPLLQIENENKASGSAYLSLSKTAMEEADKQKGKDKNESLKQAYILALMAMQDGQQKSLASSNATGSSIINSRDAEIDYESLSVSEKELFLQQNIEAIKLNILAADEKAMEAQNAGNESQMTEWNAISKSYQDALVWNQTKLQELTSLEAEVKELSANQLALIKAPTSPNALDQALGKIGLSGDQAEVIREDPELQTYFAMAYVQNELTSKINKLKMMRSSYLENGNLSVDNYTNGVINTNDPLSAISEHQQNEKRYQDALTWYQGADSLNFLIDVLEEKKADMQVDLSSFYENLEDINKQTISAIKRGEVPEIVNNIAAVDIAELTDTEAELMEEYVEEELSTEDQGLESSENQIEVLAIENEGVEVIENQIAEPNTEQELVFEEIVDDRKGDGFMYQAGTVFYTQNDPIPVDPPLPDGLIFKVQIGAFKNPLPPEHFTGLSPMTAEKLANGITRYTVGIFREIDEARIARKQVQNVGYQDAFIIAYMNGKRISLNQALQQLGEDLGPGIAATNPLNNVSQNAPIQNGGNNPAGDQNNTVGDQETIVAISATDVRNIEALFFCVQVGVFSKPVSEGELFDIRPLNVELTGSGYYRYTSGRFSTIAAASKQKEAIIAKGITDAFVTAYYQGTRISLNRASALLEEDPNLSDITDTEIIDINVVEANNKETTEQEVVLVKPAVTAKETLPSPSDLSFVIFIGSYTNSIPNNVATALLENSDVGIKRAVNAGNMIYSTKEIDSFTEATMVLQRFQQAGVEQAKMLYVLDGNEISEQKALKILAQ
jgi:hypothetical protein